MRISQVIAKTEVKQRTLNQVRHYLTGQSNMT